LVRSDALASLTEIGKTQHRAARVTTPDMVGEWLPWVHIAIGDFKEFLLDNLSQCIFQGICRSLNEFCYRSIGACVKPSYHYGFLKLA